VSEDERRSVINKRRGREGKKEVLQKLKKKKVTGDRESQIMRRGGRKIRDGLESKKDL